MNISIEKLKSSEVKITVELSELDMETYRQKALERLAGQINVKGFRPGKVPLSVAAEQLSPQAVLAQTIDLAIPPTYIEAINQEKIEPISRPQVKILSETPFKYEAIVAVYPEVKVKDYQKIQLTPEPTTVTPEQLQAELKTLQTHHATYLDITDRPAQLGDRAEIDFEGFDNGGAPLDGTKSKNHPVILGDKGFVPGFEENIIGLKIGESKEFTVTFPADYFHKPFQSKEVKFKVTLNRLEQRNLPPLDAELIKKITGRELSQSEFESEVQKNLQRQAEQNEKNRLEGLLLEQIEAKTEVDLAHSLIEEEVHYMLEEQKQNFQNRGVKWEDYLKATGKDEKTLHDEAHPEAEKRLRLRFGVQEIFKLEKIEVTDADLEAALQDELKIFASINYQPKIEEQEMIKTRLRNKLKMEKLIATFLKK